MKIAVIGGGASGLSVSYYLQKNGHRVTLYEKDNRLGGKCFSLMYKNHIYEMGCIFGASSHPNLINLMEEININIENAYLYRTFYNEEAEKTSQVPDSQMDQFANEYKKFALICKGFENSILSPGIAYLPAEMSLPFNKWCLGKELYLIPQCIAPAFTAFGYGNLDIIPTAYVLKHLDLKTLSGFIGIRKHIIFESGMEKTFSSLANYIDDIRLSTRVKKIKTGDCIRVETNYGIEKYDALILTILPTESMLEDTERKKLIQKYNYIPFNVFAYTIDKTPSTNIYFPHYFNKDSHVFSICNLHPNLENGLITAYTTGSLPIKNYTDIVKKDLLNANIPVKNLFFSKKWRNFPHVSSEDIFNGFYEKMESIQGRDGIYCAGGLMSFSNLDRLIQYSDYLVDKHFK